MRRYYSRFPDVFCKREIFTVKFEQIDTNNVGPSAQHFDKVAVGFIEKHEPAFKQMWPEPCAQGRSTCDNRGDCQEPWHHQEPLAESGTSVRRCRLCEDRSRQRWRTAPRQARRNDRAWRGGTLYRADMAIVSCLKPLDAPCAIRPCCVLKRALEKARDAFIGVLDSYNLSDLVQPRRRLANLLGIWKIKALR